MIDWSDPIHKEEKVNGYHLKCYVSDPYYYVEVFKDGKAVNSHLLSNDTAEFDELIKKYEWRERNEK